MRVLVTGATGLLGNNIVKVLTDRGYYVNVIVRNEENLCVRNENVRVFNGSFLSFDDLDAASKGCDAIIHAGAATDMSLGLEDFMRVNVGGVKNVIGVSEQNNINRIVFVSSANTIGFGSPSRLADESSPIEYPFSESYYAKSKLMAEGLLKEFAKSGDDGMRHVVILNPGFMLGAYDTKPSSGQMVKAGYRKPLMLAPKGGKSFIHVKDVAEAAANALEHGRNGENYLLANFNMSIKDFYKLLAKTCGYRQIIIPVPNILMSVIGFIGDCLRKIGIKSQVSLINVRQLCVNEYYTSAKAIMELNLQTTPLEEAVSDCEKFLLKRKQLCSKK
ncbi:MAG: NAD-dependent epimerase/dehydratase family protein [Candidatus Limimorpha sp.]